MRPLSRRTVLRGLFSGSAVAVGLPALEWMLDGKGRALADGSELPTRFGAWYWGNGVKLDRWLPVSTGANWSPNVSTAPLSGVLPYVSVASGCEVKTPYWPHHSGATAVLSGAPYYQLGTTRDTIVSTFSRQSIDQVAADWFTGTTPFRSLEIGVTRFRGTDEGTTFQHLSHNGPSAPNPAEYDPVALYRRLFGVASDARLDLVRQSVLDTVSGQIGRLQGQLGYTDRQRLDQHLSSIRDLETRLGTDMGACLDPGEPSTYPDVEGREQIEEMNEVMSQLCALALACDLTRAFSILWSTCGSGVIVWEVGATDGLHSTCHFEADPQPVVAAATTFEMQNLARFLEILRDTPEGDGNVLDRCSILCTTELCDGLSHTNTDQPMLVCGLGGGRLRGGYHYRSGSAENTSKVGLSALWGAGVGVGSFGDAEGYTTEGIGALFV